MKNHLGLQVRARRGARSLALLLALTLLMAACGGSGNKPAAAKKGGGAAPVTVANALNKDVPWEVQVIGNVEASSTITVKSQISGQIVRAHFREGDFVQKGDLLFSIDRRPLEAQLRQADANLAKNLAQAKQAKANLAKDQAQLKYARAQAARYNELMQEGVISHDQNDQVQASADAMTQAVEADKAAIDSSQADAEATRANIENLKVQLSYTRITSPITGRTGNLAVKEGNIVTANTTELMTINQVQPIFVTFAVPEARLADIRRFSGPKTPLEVTVTQRDIDEEPERGEVTFIDNSVDTTTGTIKLKATLSNTGKHLWPGQFVRVSLRLTIRQNVVVVPNQAIQTGQDGAFVYVVKADQTVEARPVTPGVRVGQDMVIDKGLDAGETIVLEGQLRLAPGMKVAARKPGEGRRKAAGNPTDTPPKSRP